MWKQDSKRVYICVLKISSWCEGRTVNGYIYFVSFYYFAIRFLNNVVIFVFHLNWLLLYTTVSTMVWWEIYILALCPHNAITTELPFTKSSSVARSSCCHSDSATRFSCRENIEMHCFVAIVTGLHSYRSSPFYYTIL